MENSLSLAAGGTFGRVSPAFSPKVPLFLLSPVRRLVQGLALTESHAGFGFFFVELHLVLLDLVGHREESALDVYRLLGRGFQERYFVLLGKLLAFLERNLALAIEVTFISDENFAYTGSGELVDLRHPSLDVLEGVLVGHIVDNNYSVRTSVI